MLKPRDLGRIKDVAGVLIRHGFEDVLETTGLLKILGRKRRRPQAIVPRATQRAESLRTALEELGPCYIKLGQILSTQAGLLPPPYLDALSHLQDRVEPLSFEVMKPQIEEALGRPVPELFEQFEETPAASASLAQVYRARLHSDAAPQYEGPIDVAVKVLKPSVRGLIDTDLAILDDVAQRLDRSTLTGQYDFKALSAQLASTLRSELNLKLEAKNARGLKASLREFPHLAVPEVVDELTSEDLLVEEFVEGTRLTNLAQTSIRFPQVAEELWRGYLKQVLVDGAFHCDPHPGNFLLTAEGKLVLLDHGMFAFVSRETQVRLMSLLLLLVEGDGERAAQACIELGIPSKDFRESRFRAELGVLVARYNGARLEEINFGQLVMEVFATCFRHHIQVAPEMALLGKALFNLEPLCRQLDPSLDPIQTTRETALGLLQAQIRRDLTLNRAFGGLLELRSFFYDVPPGLRRLVHRLANNELRVEVELGKAATMQSAIREVANRITLGLITASLILGSAQLLSLGGGPRLFGYPTFALIGFLLAAGMGLYVIVKILLSERV